MKTTYNEYKKELNKKEKELQNLKAELYKKLEKLWENTLKDREFIEIIKESMNRSSWVSNNDYDFEILNFKMDKDGINFLVRKSPIDMYSNLEKIDLLKVRMKEGKLSLEILLEGNIDTENILFLYIESKEGIQNIKNNAFSKIEYRIQEKEKLISKIKNVDENKEENPKTLIIEIPKETFSYKLKNEDIRFFMENLDNSNTFINLPEQDKNIVLNKKNILKVEVKNT